ncbi:MAG TPA: hypothetical protein VNT01_02790 [Symbiobacteriaceae bacterium]|nr:hypothetical protein [Symbiobacteriaceae bacterium]
MSRRLAVVVLSGTLVLAGCRSQAPALPPAEPVVATPAPAEPTPTPPAATQPLAAAEVHLFSGDTIVSLDGPIPVGTPAARVRFAFPAPADRQAAEAAVATQLRGRSPKLEWQDDQRLWVTIDMTYGDVTLETGTGKLTLVAPPSATPRWFHYIPSTDEGHPFSGASICGLFTEGSADPEGGRSLLLWAQQPTNHGPDYVPVLLHQGQPQVLPYVYLGIQPRFYGWLRHTDGLVLSGNGTVKTVDMLGNVLRQTSFTGDDALHGGAVSRKSGLTALFVSRKDQEIHLLIFNPANGHQDDLGAVGRRQGTPGGDASAYQWIDADWSADDRQIAFSLDGKLFRFDLATAKPGLVADGYARPRFSPKTAGQILAESDGDSAILSSEGKVLHSLPGKNWFWHLSGEALDRSAPMEPGTPAYDKPVTNYRLADRRLMERGRGLVIGHAILPPSSSRLLTLTKN